TDRTAIRRASLWRLSDGLRGTALCVSRYNQTVSALTPVAAPIRSWRTNADRRRSGLSLQFDQSQMIRGLQPRNWMYRVRGVRQVATQAVAWRSKSPGLLGIPTPLTPPADQVPRPLRPPCGGQSHSPATRSPESIGQARGDWRRW